MARLVPDEDKARLYPGLGGDALDDAVFGDLIIHSQARYLGDQMRHVASPGWQRRLVSDSCSASLPAGFGRADPVYSGRGEHLEEMLNLQEAHRLRRKVLQMQCFDLQS